MSAMRPMVARRAALRSCPAPRARPVAEVAPVHEDREREAGPALGRGVAGERRDAVQRPGLGEHAARTGRAVAQRPVDTGDRERLTQGRPQRGVLGDVGEQFRERAGRQPVRRGQPRAVHEVQVLGVVADRVLQHVTGDGEPLGRAALAASERADRLQHHLCHEVVRVAIHRPQDHPERLRTHRAELAGVERHLAGARAPGDRDALCDQRLAHEACSGAGRVRQHVAVGGRVPVHGESRQRGRLGAVERRLPLGAEAHGVEDGLVADDRTGNVAHAALAESLREGLQAAGRQRRIPGADQVDVAAVGRAGAHAAAAQRRLVAKPGAQGRERGDRRDELLVGRRRQLLPRVVAVRDLAVGEVDDRHAGASDRQPVGPEDARNPGRQRRCSGRRHAERRRRRDEQRNSHHQRTQRPSHALEATRRRGRSRALPENELDL